MKPFIKDNASIIAAILLPILFAGFFYVSKNVINDKAPNPQYDLVVSTNTNNNANYDISVINDALTVTFTYPAKDKNGNLNASNIKRQKPQIYYINTETLVAEPINYLLPSDALNPPDNKEGTSVSIPIEKLEPLKLSTATIAPDDYELLRSNARYGNIMTEIYHSRGRNRNQWGLKNSSAFFPIRGLSNGRNTYSLTHVGWVLKN